MTVAVRPGIRVDRVTTSRLSTRVLLTGDPSGRPILFLHGNLSSATWWESTLLALPSDCFGMAPDQRGFGEADPSAIIDATHGMRDLSEDAIAVLDHYGVVAATVVGSSLGGSVVWRMIADDPQRVSDVVQVAPGSPYGFGAIHGDEGIANTEDFAGSGAGLVNPQLLAGLTNRDFGTDSPFSPRNVFRTAIVRPGHVDDHEDAYLASMMATHLGQDAYPGDATPSPNWPFFGPGLHGASNALSPKWITAHRGALDADPKPPVTWIRGALDAVVADAGPGDPGVWGPTGLIPGFPGSDRYPPQPMVSQTRAWLGRYAELGGSFTEQVIENAAHAPYIDSHEDFMGVLHAHLDRKTNMTTTRSDG